MGCVNRKEKLKHFIEFENSRCTVKQIPHAHIEMCLGFSEINTNIQSRLQGFFFVDCKFPISVKVKVLMLAQVLLS